jgi:hypothetical protein
MGGCSFATVVRCWRGGWTGSGRPSRIGPEGLNRTASGPSLGTHTPSHSPMHQDGPAGHRKRRTRWRPRPSPRSSAAAHRADMWIRVAGSHRRWVGSSPRASWPIGGCDRCMDHRGSRPKVPFLLVSAARSGNALAAHGNGPLQPGRGSFCQPTDSQLTAQLTSPGELGGADKMCVALPVHFAGLLPAFKRCASSRRLKAINSGGYLVGHVRGGVRGIRPGHGKALPAARFAKRCHRIRGLRWVIDDFSPTSLRIFLVTAPPARSRVGIDRRTRSTAIAPASRNGRRESLWAGLWPVRTSERH